MSDLKQIIKQEYVKCAQDPVYFMKKYCVIQHPIRGKIPFSLYPFQEKTLNSLKDNGYLIFTFPVVGVNCLNGITEQHYINFWRSNRPTIGDVVGCITDFSLRTWQLAKLVDVVKIKRIWRFIFSIERQKATELCNTKNR